jgi:hypothetical protein
VGALHPQAIHGSVMTAWRSMLMSTKGRMLLTMVRPMMRPMMRRTGDAEA